MTKTLSLILISVIIFSCDSSTTSNDENTEQSSTENVKRETLQTEPTEDKIVTVAIKDEKALIATALQSVAPSKRENCTVKGYNIKGEFLTYKEGSNEIVCLADDPRKEGFSAASYHKSLEPFMARGRALKKEGKNGREIFEIREKEIKSGELKMGDPGSMLHIYYGPNVIYDPETGSVSGAKHRFVVYLPFATSASTGLPESPQESDHPWIMDPGTHKAHIMITPKN